MKHKFPPKFHVEKNVSLKRFNKIMIGGTADYLTVVTRQNDFIELMRYCIRNNIKTRVLGDGSNVFFSDNGFRGLVIIIKFNKLEFTSDQTIVAEAGASLSSLIELCTEKHFTGFEFCAGIPGTIGGAIFGNAGAYGKAIGDNMIRAKILINSGEIKWVKAEFFDFAYRYSSLKKNNFLLLRAEFKVSKGKPETIEQKVNEILEIRNEKLPAMDVPTAGSYFKNIKDEHNNPTAAAKLLDAVGSKQSAVGDAAVFYKHANIFYNRGNATANDLLQLETLLKEKVYKNFGIMLEREVMYFE